MILIRCCVCLFGLWYGLLGSLFVDYVVVDCWGLVDLILVGA